MGDYILRASQIDKSFVGVKALSEVDFEIKKGEIHCLAGENGSGKSTLIKIISGVYTADAGTVEIDGKSYTSITPREAMRNGIQVIYQDLSIFPTLTVKENIVLYNQVIHNRKFVDWRSIEKKAKETLEKLDLRIDLNDLVSELSVADKQLVAICRALVTDAKLLIMDEPTTALTRKEVNKLFSVIKTLQQRGIAIVFVSHKIDEVFDISEKYTILRNGKRVVTGYTRDLDQDKFAYYMTGRDFTNNNYAVDTVQEQYALEVEGLSLSNAFADISFSVKKGEIIGISGLLGSGRTELALSLFGWLPADRGKIRVLGKERHIRSVHDAMKAGIGYLPEDRLTEGLFMPQSIGENIIVSKLDQLATRGFMNDEACRREIEMWVKELTIATPNADHAVQTLSGGNQQRVVLAKWLAKNMDVLVLNGPTVGVDIGSKHDIYQILSNVAKEGKGIVVISDDLSEVMTLCHRILVIRNGRIISECMSADTTMEKLTDSMTGAVESYAG